MAAPISTLSTPTPARPITLRFGACFTVASVTRAALCTISASASPRYWENSLGRDTTICQPDCCSSSLQSEYRQRFGYEYLHLNGQCFLCQRGLSVNTLNGRYARAERHWTSESGQNDLEVAPSRRTDRRNRSSPNARCEKSRPSFRPGRWRQSIRKRSRNSLTIAPESIPAGGRTAVTEEAGDLGANSSNPNAFTPWRAASRKHARILDQLIHPDALDVTESLRQRNNQRRIPGVQVDSPAAALFFSFFKIEIQLRQCRMRGAGQAFVTDRRGTPCPAGS